MKRRRTDTWFDFGWRLLNDAETPSHKWFHAFINLLILISVGIVFYEVATPDTQSEFREIIGSIDLIILWIFAAEYFARLVFIKNSIPTSIELSFLQKFRHFVLARVRFILSPWGLIDLSALLPILPLLRSLRMLRLLRLFRSAQFFRYTNPFTTLAAAFRDNALLFGISQALVVAVTLLSAVMMYVAEVNVNDDVTSFSDTLWWAIVTITTVGYGDISPATPSGRIIASALMFAGMFVIAMFAGLVSSTLVGRLMPLRSEQVRMSSTKDHIVIAGWNLEIPMMIEEMEREYGNDMPDVIVMADLERPNSLPPHIVFTQGEPTRETELEKARLRFAKTVVVISDHKRTPAESDAVTLLTVFTIRSFERQLSEKRRAPIHIVAEILDPENYSHGLVAGADEVIETSRLGSSLLAHTAGNPGIGSVISDLLLATQSNLYTDTIPPGMIDGESLDFARARKRIRDQFSVLVIGVVHNGKAVLNPADELPIYLNDQLIFIGKGHLESA